MKKFIYHEKPSRLCRKFNSYSEGLEIESNMQLGRIQPWLCENKTGNDCKTRGGETNQKVISIAQERDAEVLV